MEAPLKRGYFTGLDTHGSFSQMAVVDDANAEDRVELLRQVEQHGLLHETRWVGVNQAALSGCARSYGSGPCS